MVRVIFPTGVVVEYEAANSVGIDDDGDFALYEGGPNDDGDERSIATVSQVTQCAFEYGTTSHVIMPAGGAQ